MPFGVAGPRAPCAKVVTVRVGILGGTGPLGRGLALRLAAAGTPVTLGSRQPERAASVADEIRQAWPDHVLAIDGAGNAEAGESDVVVMATPWEAVSYTHLDVYKRQATSTRGSPRGPSS